jgi:hypothetical protein
MSCCLIWENIFSHKNQFSIDILHLCSLSILSWNERRVSDSWTAAANCWASLRAGFNGLLGQRASSFWCTTSVLFSYSPADRSSCSSLLLGFSKILAPPSDESAILGTNAPPSPTPKSNPKPNSLSFLYAPQTFILESLRPKTGSLTKNSENLRDLQSLIGICNNKKFLREIQARISFFLLVRRRN